VRGKGRIETRPVDFSGASGRILFLLFNSRSGSTYAGRRASRQLTAMR
jgi:hypothetical protein